MEPMQYLTSAAVRSQMPRTLAFSALPDAPVLPVRPSRRQRARLAVRRLVGRRPRRHVTAVRPASAC